MNSKNVNRDIILREQLALQRTNLANQSTFLAFLRTSMYFLVAGLSVRNLLKIENSFLIEILLFSISLFIFVFGIINFIRHKKAILKHEKNIGFYVLEHQKQEK